LLLDSLRFAMPAFGKRQRCTIHLVREQHGAKPKFNSQQQTEELEFSTW